MSRLDFMYDSAGVCVHDDCRITRGSRQAVREQECEGQQA